MTQLKKNAELYMAQRDPWIYIVERWPLRKGSSVPFRNAWSRMPAVVDPAADPKTQVDVPITAAEVPRDIRKAAMAHFDVCDGLVKETANAR